MIRGLSHRVFSQPKCWIPSAQTDLLYQDFSNRVVPYRHDPKAYALSAEGVSPRQIEECLTLGRHGWKLDGFLRRVASSLLTRHEVWLEVAFGDVGRDGAPFAVFEVDGVSRASAGHLVQAPPNRDELPDSVRWDGSWEKEIELDAARMVHVSLPAAYASETLFQVVHDLAEIDSSLLPPWAMAQMAGQRPDAPRFDVKEADRTERLRIAQAALPIGWTARETFFAPNTRTTDYYRSWRELRFLHFRSSMRARAEGALRRVLVIAGKECGFTASVMAHGVYTPDEVQGFIQRFEAGHLTLSTVSDIQFERVADPQEGVRRVV